MHMADALISPAVGGTMFAAAAGAAAYSVRKIQNDLDEKKIPLMGVMGAFVFAAQMINFSIPGTGSSGHLGGGLLLAVLLGPYAGYLTMASILLIQALFFGDGGLLAYGCNLFNLGFYTCFIAYPLIFGRMTRKGFSTARIFWASTASALVGLQIGAFSVVLQTSVSGRTDLPFVTFLMFMQPIHIAIGIVEGLVTAALVVFVWKARPELPERAASGEALGGVSVKKVLTALLVSAILLGGAVSWFASTNPDGLEWSVEKTAGAVSDGGSEASGTNPELSGTSTDASGTSSGETGGIRKILSDIQNLTAILPDYGFKSGDTETTAESDRPVIDTGTSTAGIAGGAAVLALAVFTGFIIRLAGKMKKGNRRV